MFCLNSFFLKEPKKFDSWQIVVRQKFCQFFSEKKNLTSKFAIEFLSEIGRVTFFYTLNFQSERWLRFGLVKITEANERTYNLSLVWYLSLFWVILCRPKSFYWKKITLDPLKQTETYCASSLSTSLIIFLKFHPGFLTS